MPRVGLTTLGCKVNQADTARLAGQFAARGFVIVDYAAPADVYVVNTCTVTHQADRQARQLFRRARRANPAAIVVATGCYASVAPAEVAGLPDVDLIANIRDRTDVVDRVMARLGWGDLLPHETPPQPDGDETILGPRPGRTRATVKIGDGCNKFCTFCIVPYARGRERSSDPEEVVERIRRLVAVGFQEVVLTAVHMGSYGRGLRDRNTSLRSLVETILADTAVARLRLSSIEPEDFDHELLPLWSDRRLSRHVHLAVQSGCDATLRRMRRQYDTAHFRRLVEALRGSVPDVAVTTDVIVGFPGEDDAEFKSSLAFIDEMRFAQAHIFRYSPRAGTRAADLAGQVDEPTKKGRSERMIEVTERSTHAYRRQMTGQLVDVLFELAPDGEAREWTGLTDTHVRVAVTSPEPLGNCWRRVRIDDVTPAGVGGVVVD